VLAAVAVAIAIVILALPSFDDAGPEMDEGVLLAYPSLIDSDGLVPGRDFETFYGPGQPYLLAGLGELVGLDVTTERITGLAFVLVLALAAFALTVPHGRLLAAATALAVALVAFGAGIRGLAILGALAALMAGYAVLVSILRARSSDDPGWRAVAAGLLAAAALLFRPDLAPAVLLSAAPLLLWRERGSPLPRAGRSWVVGFAIGIVPLVVWAAVIGPDLLSDLISDLRASRGGRALPLPGPSSVEAGLLLATGLILLGAALAGYRLLRQDRYDGGGRVMLSAALLIASLLPSCLERADNAHVYPLAAVALAVAPLVWFELADLPWRKPGVLAGQVALAITALVVAHALVVTVHAQAVALGSSHTGHEVVNGDRSFRVESAEAAADLNALIPAINDASEPGDSVFVGPSDLSRTFYGDTFVYYLFPDLEPASFYLELNNGTANGDDSKLPEELEDTDLLVLTDRHEADTEAAGEAGSGDAQAVVDERFCTIAREGSYRLLAPCRR